MAPPRPAFVRFAYVASWALALGCANAACQTGQLKAALVESGQKAVPMAALRQAAARGQWTTVVQLAPFAVADGPDDDSAAALQMLALYRLDNPVAAHAAQEAVIAGLPATRRDAIAMAQVHWLRFKNAEAAWHLLAPALATGCDTARTCKLAQAVVGALPATSAWHAAATTAAPRQAEARVAFVSSLAATMAAAGHVDAAWALVVAQARADEANRLRWAEELFALVPRMAGGQGKRVWLDAILALPMPTNGLVALANNGDVAVDGTLAARLLTEATQRPDAPQAAWTGLMRAMARQDDRRGIAELTVRAAGQFVTPAARLVVARAAVAVRLPQLAEAFLAGADQDDAVVLAIQAEVARLRGQGPQARAFGMRVATAPNGDRSLGGLVLAQLWRGLGDSFGAIAGQALETAAQTPGKGQASAARLRAMDLAKGGNNRAAQAALLQWGLLLAAPPAAGPGDLAEDPEPPVRRVRAFILERAAGATWSDARTTLLRAWAAGGVAEPAQLRMLAAQEALLRRRDAALAADRAARAAADANLQTLAEGDGELGGVIHATLGPAGLAAWLADGAKTEVDAGQWVMGGQLLAGQFAVLGLRLVDRAVIYLPVPEFTPRVLQDWLDAGAGEVVANYLRAKPPTSRPPDLDEALVAVGVKLAAGEVEAASADLVALPVPVPPKTISPAAMRPIFELAANYGLCGVVATLAPRLLTEGDLYSFRMALQRSLDCARKLQDEPLARTIVKTVFGSRPEAPRLDALIQQLAAQGFDRLATQIGVQLQQIAPPSEDARHAWGRAHLALGEADEAVDVLRRAAHVNPRNTRMWLRAAELLDDYGELSRSVEFYRGASAADPDSTRIRVRVAIALVRLGRTADAAEDILGLAKIGGTEEDFHLLLESIRRARCAKAVYDAIAGAADADHEFERFRVELAADLGDRNAVLAGIRRLRTRGAALGGAEIGWLSQVSAWREAREAAEDSLASPEPLGAGVDSGQLLQLALQVRRDPSSAEEGAGLARLAATRATDPDEMAAIAAQELGRHGMAAAGLALTKSIAANPSLIFLCLRASLAWKAGDHAQAMALWRQIHAAALADPTLADKLRLERKVIANEPRDLGRVLAWTASNLELGSAHAALLAMLRDFLQVAPDSAWTQHAAISALLHANRPQDAAVALREAAAMLRDWPSELEGLADGIARRGGWPLLAQAAGLPEMATQSSQIALVRTNPWWLALLQGAATPSHPLPVEIGQTIARLAAYSPMLRVELANAAASTGDGVAAAKWLGDNPLACPEALVKAPATTTPKETAGAMAGALIALHSGPGPNGPAAAQAQLARWLQTERGSDAAGWLAYELTRQGHPELARACLESSALHHSGMQGEQLRLRLLAAIGFGDDNMVADAALLSLRGRRSELSSREPNASLRGPSDEVLTALMAAGRAQAAQTVLARLRKTEPGVGTPPGLVADGAGSELARIAAWDGAVLPQLRRDTEALPLGTLLAALPLAVAVSPATVESWVNAIAKRDAEPWRSWHALARAAIDLDEPELAKRAVAKARQAGAPGNALACTELATDAAENLGACRAGRSLDDLDAETLADLAVGLANHPQSEEATACADSFVGAFGTTEAALIAAAAMRHGALGPAGRARFGGWLQTALARMPQARQDEVAQTAMEDLGEFGLGDHGAALMAQALANHPCGEGQRNNAAYARFLAGGPLPAVLELAGAAQWASAGRAAYAALDTLAAVQAALGQRSLALATQRRALAAAAELSADKRVPVGLPLARYAELLLGDGQLDAARAVAAAALAGQTEDGELRDELSAVGRLRRVLKAALRAVPVAP